MFFLFRPAERDLPKFKTDENDKDGNGIPDDQEGNIYNLQSRIRLIDHFNL